MFCQLFQGLGFLFMLLMFQFKAWFSILQSSILITCPTHLRSDNLSYNYCVLCLWYYFPLVL